MEIRVSNYASWFSIPPDKAIIWSGLTGFWGLVPKSIVNTIERQGPNKLPQKVRSELIKQGFLVNKDVDDMTLAKECITRATQGATKTHRLILIINRDCNCECSYCYQTREQKNGIKSMNSTVVKKSIQYARKVVPYGSKLTVSFFGGEPLLSFRSLRDAVESFRKEIANRFFHDVRFGLTTNAVLFTENVQKLFARRYDLDWVQITFDGLEKNHDAVRHLHGGYGTFSTIWSNFDRILQVANSIRVRINVRQNNKLDVIPLSEKILTQFGTEKINIYVAPLRVYPNSSFPQAQVLTPQEYTAVLKAFYEWYFERTGKIHPDLLPRIKYVACMSAFSVPRWIGPDGTLYQCQHQLDLDIPPSSSIYNIKEMHRFVDSRFSPLQNPRCIECRFLAFCGGVCPADMVAGTTNGCDYNYQLWNMQMKLLGILYSCLRKEVKL